MFKKTHLPLTHNERIKGAMASFVAAREELIDVQLELESEITSTQEQLSMLNAQHQEATDALTRIRAITG